MVEKHAFLADIEVALSAIVELAEKLKAETAASIPGKGLKFQLVLVVAGVKFDGFALKAEEFSVGLVLVAADVAYQPGNPHLVALRADPMESL